jgi:hemerythrin-like domain-containing protein
MSDAPDLTFWLLLHQAMRESGDQLAAALSSLDEGDPTRARALHRWFRGFDGELHHHHMVEDDIFFPALAARVPSYEPTSGAEVEADHARLDELLAELRSALATMAGEGEWGLAVGRARAASSELAALLHRHLDLEDEDVLPVIARHFTVEELDVLHAQAATSLPLTQARFTVAWLMRNLDAEHQALLLAKAPGILKVVWRLTRGRYGRLVDQGFGPTTLAA